MESRVYWDSFGFQSLHSGVGQHAYSLLQALAAQSVHPKILPSLPFIDPVFEPHILSAGHHIGTPAISSLKPISLWRAGSILRREIKTRSSSIVHGLSNYNLPQTPTGSLWRKVLTVHDMIPWLAPQQVSQSLRLFLKWQMPRSLRRADAIICVSQWTEGILHSIYPETRGRTLVIPNGRPSLRKSARDSKDREPRLLTVSRNEGYKRLYLIVDILGKLPESYKWDVVTDQGGREELLRRAPSLRQRLRIHVGISDDHLRLLMQAASLYVQPSLFEGYCLPAVQAIVSLTPVLYTRGSGIDETVGGGGLGLATDASLGDWLAAIESMLAESSDWAAGCEKHCLQLPTWDEVAARTRAVYGMLVG